MREYAKYMYVHQGGRAVASACVCVCDATKSCLRILMIFGWLVMGTILDNGELLSMI